MTIDKEILSIEYDDDNENYEQFSKFLNENTNRKKKKTLREFEEMGKEYLKEMDANKNRQIIQKIKLIPYILKYSKDKYSEDDLLSYSLSDVRNIYNEIKRENSSMIFKIFKFIFYNK